MWLNRRYLVNGVRQLATLSPNMGSLIAIGSGSAFLYGLFLLCGGMLRGGRVDTMELYFESAAMIVTLISLGKYLERRSYRKTNAAVKGLVNLIPQEALVWHDGEERAVPLNELQVDDLIVVKTGQRVPVDGVITEGQAALDELGVKVADITADMLGTAKSVTISKDNTVVVGGAGSKEAIDARIAQIKGEMENTTSDFDREKLQERLAKLSGGVAVIKVGAATESELKEIKHRVEDALQATRAAVEEGIVAGGGVAFMDAAPALDAVKIDDPEEKIGVDIVKKALTAPVATIAKNAGFEGAVVVDKVAELPTGQGLNSANGEWGDMIEMGVLDPVKVSRVTLQNAASVASLILITEATVSDVPKNTQLEDAIAAATAGQQGGGMY